jgi:hypothetical protein
MGHHLSRVTDFRNRALLWFLVITSSLCFHSALAFAQGNKVNKPAASKAASKSPKKPEPAPHVPERHQTVAKINPATRNSAMAVAAKIDELVEANYALYKVTPNSLTTDEQFLRRIYLDIVGTIPTLKQIRLFNSNTDSQKRSKLIDTLLSQEGYSSHFYNYWADLLRLKETQLPMGIPGKPYCEWVKQSLETNLPYDQFVYEMLTAEGRVWDNPATGYILRDTGMPLDAMNNTIRVFLGTQIGCAQCHNHPFDRWTQKEFYEMAAFTSGTATRRNAKDPKFGGIDVFAKLKDELKTVDPKFNGAGVYSRFFTGNLTDVHDRPAKLQLPHNYQYDDAKPKQSVVPRTIFGPPALIEEGQSPRVAFAKWLTSPKNPRFAKTIANRLWKKSFGIGQIEPVDDIRDNSQPENPELMEFLTAEMIRLKFDLKEYLRILYNTKTYQREATHPEVQPGEEYHFPGPILRRMTAEQIWDSFVTMAAYNPNDYQAEPASVEAKLLNVDLAKVTGSQMYERNQQLKSSELKKAREARDKDHMYKGLLLVRASELPSPRPPGHFLRQFGQSDRESIEGSSTDGSVPQVLQMFNGPITHMLLEPKSVMYNTVIAEKTNEARIDVVFQSILTRRPSVEQRRAALAEVKAHGDAGYGNVIWALVNTREFLFIQ